MGEFAGQGSVLRTGTGRHAFGWGQFRGGIRMAVKGQRTVVFQPFRSLEASELTGSGRRGKVSLVRSGRASLGVLGIIEITRLSCACIWRINSIRGLMPACVLQSVR